MLESMNNNEFLEYKKLSPEEMEKRGILGRLVGPCASFTAPTRNGRHYSEKLWEQVFDDPIMKERIENGVCYGELGHPLDREETDIEKVAVCMSEVPRKNKDGKLMAVFDILSTPAGKILKTLCDYGSTLGVSSRGSGDTYTGFDGNEEVDPDSYTCQGFDIVLIPAVESARLKYVTESLNTKKSLKESLQDIIKEASDNDKKVIEETLDELDIDLEDEPIEENPSTDLNIEDEHEDEPVDNNEDSLVEEIQKLLKRNSRLEQKIITLNEKLSVCYAKESKYEEQIGTLKESVAKLSENSNRVKALNIRVGKLTEQLDKKDVKISEKNNRIQSLVEKVNKGIDARKSLKEELENSLGSNTNLNKQLGLCKDEIQKLNESIAELKKDIQLCKNSYSKKLERSNQLVEKYKGITNSVVDRYIKTKSSQLGMSYTEVKNRLPESYSLEDIDKVCEDLRDYKLNMSKLPFSTMKLNENVTMKAKPSKNELIPSIESEDDVVDEQLISLLKK